MFIDIEQTEGERFQFFTSTVNPETGDVVYGDPVPDAWVELRSTRPFFEKLNKNRAKKVEHVLNPKTRQMERITYFPEQTVAEQLAELDDAYDYAIVNFSGFADKKTGDEISMTRENKLKMMKVPVFDRFVAKCFKLLDAATVSAAKDEEKN